MILMACIVFHCLCNHSSTEKQLGFNSVALHTVLQCSHCECARVSPGKYLEGDPWVTGSACFIGDFGALPIFSMSFFLHICLFNYFVLLFVFIIRLW